jgi:hypothetical protein
MIASTLPKRVLAAWRMREICRIVTRKRRKRTAAVKTTKTITNTRPCVRLRGVGVVLLVPL